MIRIHITCAAIVSPASAMPVKMDRGALPRLANGWYFIASSRPNGSSLMGITVPENSVTTAPRILLISQFMFSKAEGEPAPAK